MPAIYKCKCKATQYINMSGKYTMPNNKNKVELDEPYDIKTSEKYRHNVSRKQAITSL